MAGLGGKNWTFEEEVTSSDVNGFLADQVVMRFADSAARTAGFGGAGEPTLAEGMVSYLDDTNTLAVYNGSAWVNVADADSPTGLQFIKTETVAAGSSAISVNNCFSTDFVNYQITYQVVHSTGAELRLRYRLSGTDNTSNHFGAVSTTQANSATQTVTNNNGGTHYLLSTNVISAGNRGQITVFNPNNATEIYSTHNGSGLGATAYTYVGGSYIGSTGFDGFSIYPSTGTISATVRVYGYRNS